MSLNIAPSKVEVMGWDSQSLANYMRRLKLSGCDKVVKKGSITGAQFMQMTMRDLQVFPSLYISIITKIQSDINKGEEKRTFGSKSKAQAFPKQVFVQEEEVWNSDEFDNDSDYEGPNQTEEEDGYICPLSEQQTDEQQDSDEDSEEEYDMPPFEDSLKPPLNPRVAFPQDDQARDPVHEPFSAERTPKTPYPNLPRISLLRPFKAPASQPNPAIDRSKKSGQHAPPQKDFTKSKGSIVKGPHSSTSKMLQQRTPKPTNVSNNANKPIPAPRVPTQPAVVYSSTQRGGLDPSWYRGMLTRHQAEVALIEVNKDGAFVVRDSSKGSSEHPYTLMLLKQGKIYNIKIRQQGDSYCLGNSLNKTKSFPGVKEMITHHTHNPLLLIDATDQSSEAQSQSCLLHPAGL